LIIAFGSLEPGKLADFALLDRDDRDDRECFAGGGEVVFEK
jgi:imidazolonepropionase-like amidohydrolase